MVPPGPPDPAPAPDLQWSAAMVIIITERFFLKLLDLDFLPVCLLIEGM